MMARARFVTDDELFVLFEACAPLPYNGEPSAHTFWSLRRNNLCRMSCVRGMRACWGHSPGWWQPMHHFTSISLIRWLVEVIQSPGAGVSRTHGPRTMDCKHSTATWVGKSPWMVHCRKHGLLWNDSPSAPVRYLSSSFAPLDHAGCRGPHRRKLHGSLELSPCSFVRVVFCNCNPHREPPSTMCSA